MNHSTLPMKRLKTSTASFTGGRSFCHHAADTVLSAAFSLWKGSTIFRAIASAFPMPLMSSSALMLSASPPVSCMSSLSMDTASSDPNAFLMRSESARTSSAPYFFLSLSRICKTGSIRPCPSVNFSPSSFWACPTPARNALYFVPASEPLMVACSLPRMAICSSSLIPELVALAPSAVNAADISVPLVLKIWMA